LHRKKKAIRLTPEEAVRQLYLRILINDLKYPANRAVEIAIEEGEEKAMKWIEKEKQPNYRNC